MNENNELIRIWMAVAVIYFSAMSRAFVWINNKEPWKIHGFRPQGSEQNQRPLRHKTRVVATEILRFLCARSSYLWQYVKTEYKLETWNIVAVSKLNLSYSFTNQAESNWRINVLFSTMTQSTTSFIHYSFVAGTNKIHTSL